MTPRIKKFIVPLCVFVVAFTFFYTKRHYYLPSRLEIQGVCPPNLTSIAASWNSGEGFNEYERVISRDLAKRKVGAEQFFSVQFPLPQLKISSLKIEADQDIRLTSAVVKHAGGNVSLPIEDVKAVKYGTHSLTIQRLAEKNPHASDKLVPIKSISTNRGDVQLGNLQSKDQVMLGKENLLYLMKDGSSISIKDLSSSVLITFSLNSDCGKTRILVDGKEDRAIDLYWPGGSSKIVNVDLDPHPEVIGWDKKVAMSTFIFSRVNCRNIRIHPVLLTVQLFLALFISYLAYELIQLKRTLNQPDWRSTLRFVFLREKRYYFWIMFAISFGVFLSWLLGQWPGTIMVYDSLSTWGQTVSLNFDNYFPFPLAFYVLFLRQIFDNLAVVGLFQIVVTSGMGSYVFYFVLKESGIKFVYVVPFFIAFVTSIPIGLYNTYVLADIPFSLLVLFWAFYLYRCKLYRKRHDLPAEYTFKKIFILSFLFVALCLIRQFGVIYLLFLPLLLLINKLMSPRRLGQFVLISVVLFAIFHFGVGNLLNIYAKTDRDFRYLTICANPLGAMCSSKYYYSDDYANDKEIIEKWLPVEEIRRLYYPSQDQLCGEEPAAKFIGLAEKDKRNIRLLFYKRLLPNLPIVVADRIQSFLVALGFHGVFCYNNDLTSMPFCNFSYSPKSRLLNTYQNAIIAHSLRYNGIFGGDYFYWNAVIQLILLSVSSVLYKYIPSSSIFAVFILIEVALLFFLIPSSHFRYFYFVYLSGFFVIPLVILEIVKHRQEK